MVTRTSISKKALEMIAFQEIRSFPGTEYVLSVEIKPQADRPREAN